MNVEIKQTMDQIMDLNHQVVSFMIDFMDFEKKGNNIELKQIENNKILKTLFERLQKLYRIIQEKDEEFVNIFELQNYLQESYEKMRYVSIIDIDGKKSKRSIYEKSDYEMIREAEYYIQSENLNKIITRKELLEETDKLSFSAKATILENMADKKFYGYYGIRQVNRYIKNLNQEKSEENHDNSDENYENRKNNLYQIKYILYCKYLNNKYNGILQENDKGMLALIKKEIEEENQTIALDMSEFEIKENIKINISECQEYFFEPYTEILKDVKSIKKNRKQNKNQEKNKENVNLER